MVCGNFVLVIQLCLRSERQMELMTWVELEQKCRAVPPKLLSLVKYHSLLCGMEVRSGAHVVKGFLSLLTWTLNQNPALPKYEVPMEESAANR